MKKLLTAIIIIAVLAVLFFISGPFYILNEGEISVVTRFSQVCVFSVFNKF